jgi:superfamily II DNA or RNA helicase
MQLEFVVGLESQIDKGARRTLLISATGTGKTYASAFAMRHLNPHRVLFLAHREQLLNQAIHSYRKVFGSGKTFGLLSGNSRDTNSDYVFATMQTMSKDVVLSQFDRDDFSTIIIDEVHRAGANSYQKILDYFNADLYLGMTASPDRPDGFDIYNLFDNNIAYEIRLQKALEENLLCPFHYFGITDIEINGEPLDDDRSERAFSLLTSDERVARVIEQANYYGYSGDRVKGLVFCSTNNEAAELSRKFNSEGFKTVALSGKDSQQARERAAARLAGNDSALFPETLDYIFTVDIFNEGIDIPEVNQVIMLRPTESPIIFVQQLGRGLRRAEDKEFVTILDFIGNYNNNYMIPLALSGDRSYNKDTIRKYVMEGSRVIPGSSSVHFDEIARDAIFRSIDNTSVTIKLLKEKYAILKHKLGRIPSMVDFYEYGEVDPLLFVEKKGSYAAFLMAFEPDCTYSFSSEELLALEYISKFLANGMRPQELLILRKLVREQLTSRNDIANEYEYFFKREMADSDYNSALRILDRQFLNSLGDKRRYGELFFIEPGEGLAVRSSLSLNSFLENDFFKMVLLDIIEFGLLRYDDKYANSEAGLVLYEKYSRKDVCRLLNWEKDDSSTMYGYRIKHGTCPIFVTYEKQEDISKSTQYEDAFIDQKTFSWMTRSRLTLTSPEVQKIANSKAEGTSIHLFVKKHNNEGSDFYYLGRVLADKGMQCTIEDDDGVKLPIVNFKLELEHAVPDDLYLYLIDD